MAAAVDNELHSLMLYYGENPESPDAPKPEEFFGLVLSFSMSLQKSSLEVHDAQVTSKKSKNIKEPSVTEPGQDQVCDRMCTEENSFRSNLALFRPSKNRPMFCHYHKAHVCYRPRVLLGVAIWIRQ